MTRAELAEMAEKEQARRRGMDLRLLVCCGTPCLAAGSEAVVSALRQKLAESGSPAELEVVGTGCLGPCSRGPMLTVQRQGKPDLVYERIDPQQAVALLNAHIGAAPFPSQNLLPDDLPFFRRQQRVVLQTSGLIDPEDIRQYIGHGGYEALAQVLHEMTPEEVCDGVTASGLRGRGAAATPPDLSGNWCRKGAAPESLWWPTATKVTPAPTWTAP